MKSLGVVAPSPQVRNGLNNGVVSNEEDRTLTSLRILVALRYGREQGTSPVKAQAPGHARLRQNDVHLAVANGLLKVGERVVAKRRAFGVILVEPRVRLRDEGKARIGLGHFHRGKPQGSRGGGQNRKKDRAGEEDAAKDAER